MTATPIAIIGTGCILPGADSPDALWDLIDSKQCAISQAAPSRWRADAERLGIGTEFTAQGGFVTGFDEMFDSSGFLLPREDIAALDPGVRWLFHAGRQALSAAGLMPGDPRLKKAGAILGNLSYPTRGLAEFAESHWLGRSGQAQHRFNSGLPAHLLVEGLGFGVGGYCLDAACASSLYAIKLAIDWLNEGRADLMLAGAVNAIDPLVLHAGFNALGALSPTGRSRPFHQEADGLVPAEGAALLLLKKLDRALADSDQILAVIRGVGLSNDGRSGGVLAPSASGQRLALERAYDAAGLKPADISLIECHATGTELGDKIEIEALASLYQGQSGVPIGSLKSNLGHTVTTSGAAGIIKIVEAMRHGRRPATLNAFPSAGALEGTPFRLLAESEDWLEPRRAAISGFGFGGANAHLLLEQWNPASVVAVAPRVRPQVAIVALAVRTGGGDFARRLFDGAQPETLTDITLPLSGLRIPPNDLSRALPQQVLALAAAMEVSAPLSALPRERVMAVIGAQCDAEAARHAFRLRLPESAPGADPDVSGVGRLAAPEVVGCMPNMPASRIAAQLDLAGASFTVAGEELSGLRAIEIAVSALQNGEADAVLAGAVDLCVEPVHQAAARALLPPDRQKPGDAAVMLVLRRLADAQADGQTILAVIEESDDGAMKWPDGTAREIFGHAHAASGLVELAAAITALQHSAMPSKAVLLPDSDGRRLTVIEHALGGQTSALTITSPTLLPLAPQDGLGLQLYEGRDLAELRAKLAAGEETSFGRVAQGGPRLALAGRVGDLKTRRQQALALLASDNPASIAASGIYFRPRRVTGGISFVFTGAAGAYHGMGSDLLLAFPDLAARLHERCPPLRRLAGWVYDPSIPSPEDYDLLCGSSLLCQIHTEVSRTLLGIQPDAAIGLSSGETNALFAMGLWSDMATMLEEVRDAGIYGRELSGDYNAVKKFWADGGIPGVGWENWQVLAPIEEVRAALQEIDGVYLTIINGPADCLIGGAAAGCAVLAARIGKHRLIRLGFDLACHCPVVGPAADLWRRIHHRPVTPIPAVEIYGNASGRSYMPTADSVADALTAQAVETVDFPRTIQNAWDDGIRIFIEHGPRGTCTRCIGDILGDRDHVAVSLDQFGRDSLLQLIHAAAELSAAGVPLDIGALNAGLMAAKATSSQDGPSLTLPAHPPAIVIAKAEKMEPAPLLAPPRHFSPPVAAANTGDLSSLESLHRTLTENHLDYLALSADLHRRFLAAMASSPADQAIAAPTPIAIAPAAPSGPSGPTFGRAELEALASGRIADHFGPAFAELDDFRRIVRMPMPPLLLADRVTGIDGQAGAMGTGTIWTETDVGHDSWYMHHGRMPLGIMIEAGQADLLLVSWLGADFANRGERIYRLLGCDLTLHGPLPVGGETLCYDIHIDSHASHGDTRLFFFHYDCHVNGQLRLSVRAGQAGFFSDAELASSDGVIWSAEGGEHTPDDSTLHRPPPRPTGLRSFSQARVTAFAEGRPDMCFGEGFEAGITHTRSPSISKGRTRLFDQIDIYEPAGGPWGRGYLQASRVLQPDDWFFEGHFKNDPCMPGTLMLEGCLQTMAFMLAAGGVTLSRDGWRFEPVQDETVRLRCRGQATPSSRHLVYEVFVDEFIDGDQPVLYADLLVTVDGLKAFHCRRMGLRLVADFPLEARRHLLPADTGNAVGVDGLRLDYAAMLSCAMGRPSLAFGPTYSRFDDGPKLPRLPSPPYHFMTRVTKLTGVLGSMAPGIEAEIEYDLPRTAWYFDSPSGDAMRFCVLLEAALQPCGWLASYAGVPLSADIPLFFRNLDGKTTIHRVPRPGDGPLVTNLKILGISKAGSMVILDFAVSCRDKSGPVLDMTTVFGFFPGEALLDQVGMPASEEDRAFIALPDNENSAAAVSPVRCLDRLSGFWPTGGKARLGLARGETSVDPGNWYFKAHFYQDPVQPGSIGIEALLDLLRECMCRLGMTAGMDDPRFEPVLCGTPLAWKYRGQVSPTAGHVTTIMEIVERRDSTAIGRGTLWVGGRKFYEATLGLAVNEAAGGPWISNRRTLDVLADPWLADHCPTYRIPSLPLMSVVDMLAGIAAGRLGPEERVAGITNLRLTGWIAAATPRTYRFSVDRRQDNDLQVELQLWQTGPTPDLTRFTPAASALVHIGQWAPPPDPWPALTGGTVLHDAEIGLDLYRDGRLFHGPAFQVLHRLRWEGAAASAHLIADAEGKAPAGHWGQALLDGVTQAIPNDRPEVWLPDLGPGWVGYPVALNSLTAYGVPPSSGTVRAEVRLISHRSGTITFGFQVIAEDRVWIAGEILYRLFPKGRLGSLNGADRLAFLRDQHFVEGAALSTITEEERNILVASITDSDIRQSDWLPGTLAALYGLDRDETDLKPAIAVRDLGARLWSLHPSQIVWASDRGVVHPAGKPELGVPVTLVCRDESCVAKTTLLKGAS